jgi:DNA-binding CsgD family transcriptional regulator
LPQYRLHPLTEEAAQSLVGNALAPTVRRRVLAEAAGNPLALLELPDALTGAQRRAAAQLPAVLPLTERLEALYADRVKNLPGMCRWTLLLGALGGRNAIRVVGRNYLETVAPAERDHLVSVARDGGEFTFNNSLIRAAVVSVSTTADRRRAHQALATALNASPERRAWHLGEAATEPDENVAGLLERSAELAHARGDSERAIASLTRAAELSPEPNRRARRLALAAYLGADAAGEIDIAEQFALLARRHKSAPLLAVVASAMVLTNGDGDIRAAHDLVASAIEAGDHGYDAGDRTLSEALHTLLFLSWYAGDERAWERCLAAFARLQGPVEPSLALESELLPDPARTDPAVASRLRTMLAGLPQETDPTYVSRVGGLAFLLDWEGAARDELWRVVRHTRAGTAPMRRRITGLAALGFELFHTGQWKSLQDVADEGAALCEESGFTFILWYFRYQRALLAATRGEGSDDLLHWASKRGARGVEMYARQARALHHNGIRDHAAAYQDATAIAPAGSFPRFMPQALWAAFDLVEAAVHTGRPAEAKAHAAAMRDLPVCLLSSRLALLSAGAAAMVADDADVRYAFEAALRSPDAHRWPFEHGRIRLAYGERLRRMRATQDAREQLRAAADIFRELPAPSWLERAESEIRATGLSRPRNASCRFTELTPKEWEIAELAASGMSNKEIGERLFLSHRTIGSHLYQIFPKLGLSSRAGLRDALLDLSERQRV